MLNNVSNWKTSGWQSQYTNTGLSSSKANLKSYIRRYLQPLFSLLLKIVKSLLNILLKQYLFSYECCGWLKIFIKLFSISLEPERAWFWSIEHNRSSAVPVSGTTSCLLEPLFGDLDWHVTMMELFIGSSSSQASCCYHQCFRHVIEAITGPSIPTHLNVEFHQVTSVQARWSRKKSS